MVVALEFTPSGLPPLCVFGSSPIQVITGRLPDVAALESALIEGRTRDWKGGIAGIISYEGNYRFGVFPSWQKICAEPMASKMSADFYQLRLRPAWTEEQYVDAVSQAKEWIAAGDIYQACITYNFVGSFSGAPLALYSELCRVSPAPMRGFYTDGETTVLSASPELFLDFRGREVCTRPIKGTRRREIGNPAADDELRRELLGSEKERAELTMITDLERNDLGQFCEYGSVWVEDFPFLETYAQVHHLVASVRGRMCSGISHPAAVAACFPGGSITGAPKIRACEIIAELEKQPRGFYTGAMGVFGFDGNSRFNLLIRTLVVRANGQATFGTGAGIVADSDPAAEWRETLAKAAGVLSLCREDFT